MAAVVRRRAAGFTSSKEQAALAVRGIRRFYDADEQVDLWGKYLAEELSTIYRQQSAVVASAVPPT
jgi:hypothetical protein